jgi:hypothetical protein
MSLHLRDRQLAYLARKPWTREEESFAFYMFFDEQAGLTEIAERLGRAFSTVEYKIEREEKRRRLAQGPRAQRDRAAPNRVLLEREKMLEARERAPISVLILGDPAPGFSALDKKRAQEARRYGIRGRDR